MSEAFNVPCLSIGPHQPSSDWPPPDETPLDSASLWPARAATCPVPGRPN